MAPSFDDTILDAEYEGVRFPVSEAPYQGGHDHAAHSAYLRPGAVYEPTGRKAYTGRLVCPMVNTADLERRYGVLFPDLVERLRLKLQDRPIGRLVHPVLGALTVMVTDWSAEVTSDNRSGTPITLEWSEHNASVAEVVDLTESPGRSPEDIQRRADTADAAVSAIDPSAAPLRPTMDTHLATITDETTRVSERESAFAAMDAAVTETQALDSLSESEASTAQLELERLRGAILQLRASTIDQDATLRVLVLPRTMSLAEVTAEVYGTVSTAALAAILGANTVARPLAIPAGTTLRIPALAGSL